MDEFDWHGGGGRGHTGGALREEGAGGGEPRTLSDALRAILYPNESAHTLFKRARTKPFRTGLEIFDLAEQFMYGGGAAAAPSSPLAPSPHAPDYAAANEEGSEREEIASASSAASQQDAAAGGLGRGGIRGGDVVEFYGKTGSGKTELLLHIVASAILPPSWTASPCAAGAAGTTLAGRRLELDGEGAGVVFFDNDLKFDIRRLERVLRVRIRSAVAKLSLEQQQRQQARRNRPNARRAQGGRDGVDAARKRQRVDAGEEEDDDNEQHSAAEEWTSAHEDELIQACLARLTVFRCEDSLQFLTTLQLTDELIRNFALTQKQQTATATATTTTTAADKGKEKEKEEQEQEQHKKAKETTPSQQRGREGKAATEVKVIVIDSIGAFHNADRYAEPYSGGGGGGFGGKFGGGGGAGNRSRMNKVVLALKQLVNAHNLIVFAGKGAPFGKLTRNAVLNPASDPHHEYLGDSWQNFVKYRLVLVREEESLGGRPHFWAFINKPSLTITQQPSASVGASASSVAAGLRPQPAGGGMTRARTRLFPFTVTAAQGLSFHDPQAPESRKM